jgi:hypothetical protein
MKTIITSVKGPSLRRVLCSFLLGAAAFCVVPANIQAQAPADIVWVTTGNSIAAYNADGTPLNGFNVITLQPVLMPNTPGWVGGVSLGGILVSGPNLYVAAEWVPAVNIGQLILQRSPYRFDWYINYVIATYAAKTGSMTNPGAHSLRTMYLPLTPAGMALSVGTYYVANYRGSITKENLSYFNPSYIYSPASTVIKAPYALAVNGTMLYVTNNAQSPNGNFYISTYNTASTPNGSLLNPYFIENQTGTTGLYGLALSKDNTILYVSVFSGSAPGVYGYNLTTKQQVYFVSVKEPWGIAIGSPRIPGGNPTLYVASQSQQDSAIYEIYEFDAINGGQPFGSIKLSAAPTNITVEPATQAVGN